MKYIIVANCPEKFKILDFNNFSRIPLCSSNKIESILNKMADFKLHGIRENVIPARLDLAAFAQFGQF